MDYRIAKKYSVLSHQYERLRRALHYSKPPKAFVAAICGLSLVISALGVAEPLVLKYIFDSLGQGAHQMTRLLEGIGLLLALVLLRECLSGISGWLTWKTKMDIQFNLLSTTVEKLYVLSVDSHRKEGVGAVMTRLDRGIQGFVGAISGIAFSVLPGVTYLVMAIVAMVHLDWRLTIAVLLFVPFPALIQYKAAPEQTAREKWLFAQWGKVYARFNEVLSGIVTVRSFAMEHHEQKRFLGDVATLNDQVLKGIGHDSRVLVVQNLITVLARVTALCVGGYLVVRGQLTVGTVVAFLGYVTTLFGPVQGLTAIYRTMKTASVSLDHIFSILDSRNFLPDAPHAVEVTTIKGDVAFHNVSFRYPSATQAVLKGVDLHVPAGTSVAIVGPSGTGKSSLMALLQRFYDADGGSILIDGLDVRSIQQLSLRRCIGVVQQDVLLFNDTVRNNIAYGRPAASLEEIIAAAKTANIHDFICGLENGYDTTVGERGGFLSMGERQRIAIARAILKDPPILILDEATSALDAELEAAVQQALHRLMQNRTTFIIAHRLATVVKADQIIVLKDGHITEQGPHRELLARDGYYASLVHKQTKDLVLV